MAHYKKALLIIAMIFLSSALYAVGMGDLVIIAEDGTFLGSFENEYAAKSIYNQYGTHGSQYSTDSIFNKYGNYGSDYSNESPFNRYATNAPGLYDRKGNFYGTLSINQYADGVTKDTYSLASRLKGIRDSR